MRSLSSICFAIAVSATSLACSSASNSSFALGDGSVSPDGTVKTSGSDGGVTFHFDGGGHTSSGVDAGMLMMTPMPEASVPPDGMVITMTTTTIYAHTDTELYSMDPSSHALTDIGTFKGTSGSTYDSTITDLAVDANGDVYVNSETVIYKVALPTTPGAGQPVMLTSFANTAPNLKAGSEPTTKFYALAFAPAGAIGVATIPDGETLVGGDSNGELWVIKSDGTTIDVGNFGADPDMPTKNFLALSGDLVFYDSGDAGTPTGMATIRSCPTGGGECIETDDHLAGIDMANLKANAAASGGTPASLLGGIYGGTTTTDGPGTGQAELFGLGAWQGDVYGFARCYHCYDGGSDPTPAALVQIDPTTGKGTVLTSSFPFTDGWSGAGVTTKVTVTVIAPPPTQPPPNSK